MLHTLGSSIEHSHKEELEKYITVDKDPIKRTITSLVFRNSMLTAPGDLCYRVENGRRLVVLPVNGSGYGVPFIVTCNPTFPTKGWHQV